MEFLRENLLEVISLTLSCIAIGVAVWQMLRNRRFQVAMERPRLLMGLDVITSEKALQFSVKNIGRGPAYITRWECSINYSEWGPIDWSEIFGSLFPDASGSFMHKGQLLSPPGVIKPFASCVLIKLRLREESDWSERLNHVWRVFAHSVRLRIRYKSDLAKKEYELLADASQNVPQPNTEPGMNG